MALLALYVVQGLKVAVLVIALRVSAREADAGVPMIGNPDNS